MTEFMGAFPVLPGKRETLREYAKECAEKSEDFNLSMKRHGTSEEKWFLQEGDPDLCLVYFKADDVAAMFEGFAQSNDPFDVWQRDKILEITGVDMAQPGPPPPTKIFDSEG